MMNETKRTLTFLLALTSIDLRFCVDLAHQRLFAYVTQEKYEENGWTVYKPVEEFRRQVRTRGSLL